MPTPSGRASKSPARRAGRRRRRGGRAEVHILGSSLSHLVRQPAPSRMMNTGSRPSRCRGVSVALRMSEVTSQTDATSSSRTGSGKLPTSTQFNTEPVAPPPTRTFTFSVGKLA
ncbi:hypothetical protein HPB50_028400 [Hyalomma asiaticum]|nr:hypothetical protein HPB50_028400 [Hyalomma asiaticum]